VKILDASSTTKTGRHDIAESGVKHNRKTVLSTATLDSAI
jgi:hypothetical protein